MPADGFVCVSDRRSTTAGQTIGVNLADDLRACLALVLGFEPPAPEGEPLLFFRQWLGERNLGLVPVADPATLSWSGYWIGRVGEHALLLYGSPAGPVHDPAGVYADGAVEDGWLVAKLDLHLDDERPYGVEAGAGTVVGLLTAPDAEAPLVRVESVEAVAGRGLEGDRYAAGRGTFGGGRGYELTLVSAEALAEVELSWEQARRNVVTEGVDLNALAGKRFRIGGVECVGRRLAEPCVHLERLSRPGIMRPLVHRAGLRADILTSGRIAVGDAVSEV
jgi:MOSC domain